MAASLTSFGSKEQTIAVRMADFSLYLRLFAGSNFIVRVVETGMITEL